MSGRSELRRKAVHIGMVGFALFIGRAPAWFIVAMCALAIVFNLALLPRLTGRGLEREEDLARGFSLGMLAYPASLLLLSLVFYERQVFLAIGWAAMAFGDGFAGLLGRAVGGPKLSWRPDKTWAGLAGFILMGVTGAATLTWLLPEPARLGIAFDKWLLAIVLAMIAAALAETAPGTIDDNLAVPIAAALTAYLAVEVDAIPPVPDNWLMGLGLVALLTIGSIASKKIDAAGGLAGGLIAWLIFLGGGYLGVGLLFLFFIAGSAASHWKMREKARDGLAQEDLGRRSLRHAVSNGGVAGVCGLLAWLFPAQAPLFLAMLAGALASATADTLSSELGNVYGRRFVNIVTFKPDRRGLDGVVSLEGTMCGAAGALAPALALALFGGGLAAGVLVWLAGVFGNLADSVLGATLQRRGYMTNDSVNFANTLLAALFAAAAGFLAGPLG